MPSQVPLIISTVLFLGMVSWLWGSRTTMSAYRATALFQLALAHILCFCLPLSPVDATRYAAFLLHKNKFDGTNASGGTLSASFDSVLSTAVAPLSAPPSIDPEQDTIMPLDMSAATVDANLAANEHTGAVTTADAGMTARATLTGFGGGG